MNESKQVLVVDDDRAIARALGLRLRAAGYTIATASNGEEGLREANRLRPNAILLDVRMPLMDGLTMLGKLREQPETQAIPTVVLSANVVEETRRKALDLGAQFFLAKPCDYKVLLSALESAMAAQPIEG